MTYTTLYQIVNHPPKNFKNFDLILVSMNFEMSLEHSKKGF